MREKRFAAPVVFAATEADRNGTITGRGLPEPAHAWRRWPPKNENGRLDHWYEHHESDPVPAGTSTWGRIATPNATVGDA